MVDSTEELEPLFDYRRVQPFNIISLDDDDSDVAPPPLPKRRKVEEGDDDVKVVDVVNNKVKDDEDDWLPPPPKISGGFQMQLGEDSTIKELRLKKQELESFARSAQDVLRSVEECAKKELGSSLQDSLEVVAKQRSKPAHERAKIIISIQDKNELQQFRVFKDDKFEQIFQRYAEKVKLDVQSLAFCFDGDKVSFTATPDSLGMEDDDIIEVHEKKH